MKKKMTNNVMPLNKYIAVCGYASRRKAIELIKMGSVSVNGAIIKEPGYKVTETDHIKVNGKLLHFQSYVYLLLNKPKGFVTSLQDEKKRPTVIDLLGRAIKQRLYPVGRLDINTTGLLLLTNDGQLAQRLAHPKFGVEKIYAVTLSKNIQESDLEIIKKGVRLPDGFIKIDHISLMPKAPKNIVRVVLHSGKYRIVRRLFEYLGYFVNKLDRIGYAGLNKKGLKVGQWRFLTAHEIEKLKKMKK